MSLHLRNCHCLVKEEAMKMLKKNIKIIFIISIIFITTLPFSILYAEEKK